jgi:hypothetical protein
LRRSDYRLYRWKIGQHVQIDHGRSLFALFASSQHLNIACRHGFYRDDIELCGRGRTVRLTLGSACKMLERVPEKIRRPLETR